jgi:two-component system invasion response regulator UvrY
MIKVLIADDHPIVRHGLKQIISNAIGMEVAGEAEDGHQAVQRARTEAFDVVVLDISMPGPRGLDVLRQIRHSKPDLPILILSVHPEEQYAIRALKAGASGYLTKTRAPEELVLAINTVAVGRKYITSSLAERLATELQTPAQAKPLHEKLSDREYEVLRLIGQGKATAEIAERMFLSPKTVSTYRSRILHKMNMKTSAELMRYALDHGLVE